MVSRFCEMHAGVQRGLAHLERGGPPRRLGDVLGEVMDRFDVQPLTADEPQPLYDPCVSFDTADQRFRELFADQVIDRFWAVA